jgi:hypothetical protein
MMGAGNSLLPHDHLYILKSEVSHVKKAMEFPNWKV